MRSSFAVAFASTFLSKLVFAESIQEMVWVVPDGAADDLSSDFTQGTTLPVKWNGWDETDYINPYEDLVDLWCTTWELSATAANNYLLQQNLNLTTDGSYNWPIKISNDDLALTAKWVLRFKAHASDQKYDASTEDLASPGFIVLVAASQSTSADATSTTTSDKSSSTSDSSSKTTDSDSSKTTAAASSTDSSSSATTTTGTSTTKSPATAALASSTSTSTDAAVSKSTSSGGLSSGAKAGVGIACAVGALALIGTIIAFFVKKRHERNAGSPPDYSTGGFGAAEAAMARELKPQPQVATYPYKREVAYEQISETKPYQPAQPQTYQPPQAQTYQPPQTQAYNPPQVQAYNPPQAPQAYPTGNSQTPYSVSPAQTYSSVQPPPAQTHSELHTNAPTSPISTGNGGSFPMELSNNEIVGPVELPGHGR